MPKIFQKIANALARPFTRQLWKRMEDDAKQLKKLQKTVDDAKQLKKLQKIVDDVNSLMQKNSSQLTELSRYTADSFDQMCSLHSGQIERLDHLMRRIHFPIDSSRALIHTQVGYMICDRTEPMLVSALVDSGDIERGLRLFLGSYLQRGMRFVDVGANIGMHTIAAAKTVGSIGHVIAFEATPSTADWLRQNVALNNVGEWTVVHNSFVGASAGTTDFHISSIGGWNSKFSVPNEVQKIELPVASLDEMIPHGTSVDLFKIDVEGAELEVFAGMKTTLLNSPDACIIAEFASVHLERAGANVGHWKAFCLEHSFDVYVIAEMDGTLRESSFDELMSLPTVNVLMARGSHYKKCL